LARYTASTVTDPRTLAIELRRVRRQGWAEDYGEHNMSAHAVAAPVHDVEGNVVAALSLAFLADKPATVRETLRETVCRTAASLRPVRQAGTAASPA
jgi:DNA-binding IclR family transcriptional regulator